MALTKKADDSSKHDGGVATSEFDGAAKSKLKSSDLDPEESFSHRARRGIKE